jgi:hypothetical protein
MRFVALTDVFFFKSFVITNASMMRTPEQDDYFSKNGMKFVPNFVSKLKVGFGDEKDENIATLWMYIDCFSRQTSLSGNKF